MSRSIAEMWSFQINNNAEKERAKITAFAKSDTFNPLAVGCSVSTKMVMCLHKGEGKGREEGHLLMSGFEIGVEKPNSKRVSLSFSYVLFLVSIALLSNIS